MKLIDKDRVAAEIEKKLQDLIACKKDALCPEERSISQAKINMCKEILSFLDTIETKEVDLEKEFYDFLDTLIGKDNGHLSEDELFRIAEYFYELGLNTHKKE